MDIEQNITALNREIDWLQEVIEQAITTYLMQEGHEKNWRDVPLPDVTDAGGPFADFVNTKQLWKLERLAIALAMAPHIRPEVLDIFFAKNQLYDRGFTEFGGATDKNHNGFLPTGQTLCFLVTVGVPEARLEVMNMLDKDGLLIREGILALGNTEGHVPLLAGILSIDEAWLRFFMTGVRLAVENSPTFPAQRITTQMEWEDVVLDGLVMDQVNEILAWLQHSDKLMNDWGLNKKIKPGYRVLFYGPPGTGKTLTTTLIGKRANKEVYRIDLSMVVSKYIGETEKNLAKIFDTAERKEWILFFDEADSLFGKRTETSSSNDRYANQQAGYLLQRIEDFPGLVILASNLKANMDEAFSRRFQSIIHFTMPSAQQRFQLWKNAFSGQLTLHPDIDLDKIAESYELAGGAIINVLRTCALAAVRRHDNVVNMGELIAAIRKEYKKENKTI